MEREDTGAGKCGMKRQGQGSWREEIVGSQQKYETEKGSQYRRYNKGTGNRNEEEQDDGAIAKQKKTTGR